jgi:hypothetical protein
MLLVKSLFAGVLRGNLSTAACCLLARARVRARTPLYIRALARCAYNVVYAHMRQGLWRGVQDHDPWSRDPSGGQ